MKIGYAAHDAGGAEILSSWIANCYSDTVHAVLEGPARNIFSRKLGHRLANYPREDFLSTISSFDMVITGTSWASDLEKQAHRWCKSASVRSAAFLDHWTEYTRRFTLNDSVTLPDEIWVTDSYAEAIAGREFPEIPLRQQRNFYLEEITDQIRLKEKNYQKTHGVENILYCTEPTSVVARTKTGDPNAYGYTEHSALENMLAHLKSTNYPAGQFRLRKHPSESPEKYEYVLKKNFDFPVSLSITNDLAEDCAWADTIAGCDSMVMTIGVLANKKVFCCIPKGGRPLSNPYPQIQKLSL